MMTVRLICIGKLKEKYLSDACKEYQKRLGAFCKLELLELPEYKLQNRSVGVGDHRLHPPGRGGDPCKDPERRLGDSHVHRRETTFLRRAFGGAFLRRRAGDQSGLL